MHLLVEEPKDTVLRPALLHGVLHEHLISDATPWALPLNKRCQGMLKRMKDLQGTYQRANPADL